jgi:hypothetical protein
MNQKRPYPQKPSGRTPPKHSPSGKTFLIVTEGKKTEPNYFEKLREHLRLTSLKVVHPEGTDPVTLTKNAIALRDKQKQEAKKRDDIVPFDEVWVVFDLEKPHDQRRELAQKAIDFGKPKGIRFAKSDPCFEYWLLLHWRYTTAPFACCDDVIKSLKFHWADYDKGFIPDIDCIEKFPMAVKNAERCRKFHEDCGSAGNPSTSIDSLVRELNKAARVSCYVQLD